LYREKKDIDNMVDALAKIVMLIPTEQERVEKRVNDIGPKAVEKFKKKLATYQKEEEERIRREEEAEVGGEEVTETAEKPEPEPKPEPKPESKPKPKPKSKPAPKKDVMKEAKAAYDLGMYYKKLGLDVEANKELAKALKIYESLEKPSSDTLVRISEIRVMIGSEKKKKAAPKTEPTDKKKRKVSFV
jgi:hypothetical protein